MKKKQAVWLTAVWILAVLAIYGISARYFYLLITYFDISVSDLQAHIKTALSGKGYGLTYALLYACARLGRVEITVPLILALLVPITMGLTGYFISRHFHLPRWQILVCELFLVFMCPVYLPGIRTTFYAGSLVTQPWHNAPYIGMRLFAVLFVNRFLDIQKSYDSGMNVKNWLLCTLYLALSTSNKPSFLFGFAPFLLLILVCKWARARFSGKVFLQCVVTGLMVLPSVGIALFQASRLFGEANASKGGGIALVSPRYTLFSRGYTVGSIDLARSFILPVLILLLCGLIRDRGARFMTGLTLFTLMETTFLTETGPRAADGNFWWGIYNASYLWLMVLLPGFFQEVNRRKGFLKVVLSVLCGGLILVQMGAGIYYFVMLAKGTNFFF